MNVKGVTRYGFVDIIAFYQFHFLDHLSEQMCSIDIY